MLPHSADRFTLRDLSFHVNTKKISSRYLYSTLCAGVCVQQKCIHTLLKSSVQSIFNLLLILYIIIKAQLNLTYLQKLELPV